jgi:hypothetical protein
MSYPVVLDEFQTIERVIGGMNLARCGDGEAKIASGAGYSREPANQKLTEEMREVMRSPHPRCLVGIPTLAPEGPKYQNWLRHQRRLTSLVDENRVYGSAFVSRPDSSPWIATKAYAERVQSLWLGKRAAVICEATGSMLGALRIGAADVVHIECPHAEAYGHVDSLEAACVDVGADIVVMAAGPTATCLANRLAAKGVHAVDLGSCGRFLQRMLLQ